MVAAIFALNPYLFAADDDLADDNTTAPLDDEDEEDLEDLDELAEEEEEEESDDENLEE